MPISHLYGDKSALLKDKGRIDRGFEINQCLVLRMQVCVHQEVSRCCTRAELEESLACRREITQTKAPMYCDILTLLSIPAPALNTR